MDPWLRVVWPFPLVLPGRSPDKPEGPSRTLPRWSAATGCPVTRTLHGLCLLFEASISALAEPPRWKPPRLVGRLSWDSSVRPSIDFLPGSGPPALPPPGRQGMPLPRHCRSRGFTPPQRITVPASRRRIAACCRSWGSSRFFACRFATGQAGRCARRLSRDAGSYPSKNPLAGSRTASPRPLRLLRFHRIRCLLPTACAAGRRYRIPADHDGLWPTDCSTDLHTSHPGSPATTEVASGSPRSPIGPLASSRAPFPPPLRAEAPEPDYTRGVAASGPYSTDEFVPGTLRNGYRNDASTVLPGLRSPSRSLLPRPCGRNRHRHRRSGRGTELRCVALSTRAVHAVTRTPRRHAWGVEDTGKPGPRPDTTLASRAPRSPALAGPGTESLRGFTLPPLARRPGAPGVCPEPKWAGGSTTLHPV